MGYGLWAMYNGIYPALLTVYTLCFYLHIIKNDSSVDHC